MIDEIEWKRWCKHPVTVWFLLMMANRRKEYCRYLNDMPDALPVDDYTRLRLQAKIDELDYWLVVKHLKKFVNGVET